MLKILPVVLVVVLMTGFVLYLRFSQAPDKPVPSPSSTITSSKTSTVDSAVSERLINLEEAVALLGQKLNSQTSDSTPGNNSPSTSTDFENRLKKLENSVSSLQKQLSSQPTSTPQTAPLKTPLYVPLGWVGAATSTDWSTISTQEITLNAADYPGYTSMQFEVSLRAYQGNGKAYARIYNNTDGTGVLSSEVSTSSQDYTWVSSGTFSLPSGKKTYRLQLKSLTGYEAGSQNARLKINF
ncbi:MAG: hypothetical protein Q7S44_03325 [bacterium]|nr:hypothetical protein [bacterium]